MAPRTRTSGLLSTLQRKGRLPIWAQISWRVLFVLALLGLAIAVHWFERDGLRDTYDGAVSFLDVVYFTMISITTTGYGDITPVSDRARLFDALIVTPIRVFAVLVFLGTAYSFVLRRTWYRWRMAYIQRNLNDHIVIAGYGTSGQGAVSELLAHGTDPSCIVVIDMNNAALDKAKALGCNIIQADATRDRTLEDVRIDRARAMIISAGRDDTSILMVLTARHLAPDLSISVAIRNEDNELPARQAGATTVINPVSFTGLLLATSTHGANISDYLADLASTHGRVRLVQRPVRSDEIGHPLTRGPKTIGLRIYRNGRPHGFWESEAQALEADDIIIEILPTMEEERHSS
ncbi:potassium channel family protein [Allosphingosinicella vermicomposti]|uniref:potassium channel family protein n=1 Tax=Allosphingosinicella vermicomposti TaxID=614671 RepID=UPI000D11019D|nr:potassium channel family protein [Allosphingosinicella vermicomposti]